MLGIVAEIDYKETSSINSAPEERLEADGIEKLHRDCRKGRDRLCRALSELDVASQGDTVESATANLKEAVELFLECADPAEVERRLHTQVFVTRFEAAHG